MKQSQCTVPNMQNHGEVHENYRHTIDESVLYPSTKELHRLCFRFPPYIIHSPNYTSAKFNFYSWRGNVQFDFYFTAENGFQGSLTTLKEMQAFAEKAAILHLLVFVFADQNRCP